MEFVSRKWRLGSDSGGAEYITLSFLAGETAAIVTEWARTKLRPHFPYRVGTHVLTTFIIPNTNDDRGEATTSITIENYKKDLKRIAEHATCE